jgi:putative phosphoribosyl transferase
MAGADEAYLAREGRAARALRRRRAQYTPARAPADPAGRIAIVVDDGIATGASMIAALHAVRAKKPARWCAQCRSRRPTASSHPALRDEVVCLETPEDFMAVGQFYRHFEQVEDEEVVALLARHAKRSPSLRR